VPDGVAGWGFNLACSCSVSPLLVVLLPASHDAESKWFARILLAAILPFLPAVRFAACLGVLMSPVTYRHSVFPESARSMFLQPHEVTMANIAAPLLAVVLAVHLLSLASLALPRLRLAYGPAIVTRPLLNHFGRGVATFSRKARSAAPGLRPGWGSRAIRFRQRHHWR
jgi:hypothetical protein